MRGPQLSRTGFFVPTPDELRTDAAVNTASGISSASADGCSTAALDPIKQLDAADRLDARAAIDYAVPRAGFMAMLLGRKGRARFGGPGT